MRALIVSSLLLLIANAPAEPTRTKVRASKIDPGVKSYPEIGFVLEKEGEPQDLQYASYDHDAKSRDRLVIWLMGNNGALSDQLTADGFHFIGVHYARQWFSRLCQEKPVGEHCRGNVRLEAATGKDESPELAIEYRDSIAGRSVAFVRWLAKEDRRGRWGKFLTADKKDLIWDKVVLAGASHGATTAARFAKEQKVARVVCLCGPRDQYQAWQALPSATPEGRFFCFSHVLDMGWKEDHYPRSWKMMGLEKFGEITDVDSVAPPYGGSRMLTTAIDVGGNAGRAHGAVQPGKQAVKDDDGNYVHAPVWEYLFTHPVD